MILLLGATGYVGTAFTKFLTSRDIEFISAEIRYENVNTLEGIIEKHQVHAVINCAGYTGKPNVDECEKNRMPCLYANALLVEKIAEICCKKDIRLCHISSGCIFRDPKCEKGLSPSKIFSAYDKPNFDFNSEPVGSFYSSTKSLGEAALLRYPNVSICRLRIPFNGEVNPRNIIHKLINYPKLADVTNSFSNLDEFVEAATDTIDIKSEKALIYNLTNPGFLSSREVVSMLIDYDLVTTKSYFNSYEEFSDTIVAPRSNCVLANNSIHRMTPIRESMVNAIKQYRESL